MTKGTRGCAGARVFSKALLGVTGVYLGEDAEQVVLTVADEKVPHARLDSTDRPYKPGTFGIVLRLGSRRLRVADMHCSPLPTGLDVDQGEVARTGPQVQYPPWLKRGDQGTEDPAPALGSRRASEGRASASPRVGRPPGR